MIRALVVLALTVAPIAATRSEQAASYDLKQWSTAVAEHTPGLRDPAANTVNAWSRPQLVALSADIRSLLESWSTGRFTPAMMEMLTVMRVSDDPSMTRFVKRAAMLHADIAMLLEHSEAAAPDEPLTTRALVVGDGRNQGYAAVSVHWRLGRVLLNAVRPDPRKDEMVRRWYGATAAYMETVRRFDDAVPHLATARLLFPDDARIFLYSGAIREFYASAEIQSAINALRRAPTTDPATGLLMVPTVSAPQGELELARGFYRHARESMPGDPELALRLGRVLGNLGDHEEAITQLREAKAGLSDRVLRFYASLFLGAEYHRLKQREPARSEFRDAAAIFPHAQSPLVALSELSIEDGDRAAALTHLQAALRPVGPEDDPWPRYMLSHVRNVSDLLRQLHDLVPAAGGF